MRRRRGRVPAGALGGEGQVHHALLRDADQGAGAFDAREHVLDHGAALVYHERGRDAAAVQFLHDGGRGRTVDLLIARKGHIQVVFRDKALVDPGFDGLHDGAERALCVERAAAPEYAVLYYSLKRRLAPGLRVGGDHVVMGHEHGRARFAPALPAVEQAVVADMVERAGAVDTRIPLGEQGAELFKLGLVDRGLVIG